jgi:competence protein ComGF
MSKAFKKNRVSGFTLIEFLIAFSLSMFILGVFYMMYGTYQGRLIKMIQKARGQQAVRLLLTKMRQELKTAVKIEIPENTYTTGLPNSCVKIYMGYSNLRDIDGYAMQYCLVKETGAIHYLEFANDSDVQKEANFLGGLTQIQNFYVHQSSLNEQIMTQKHRVDVEIDYYDSVKTERGSDAKLYRPMSAKMSVYPRTTNMSLKIDVPQG